MGTGDRDMIAVGKRYFDRFPPREAVQYPQYLFAEVGRKDGGPAVVYRPSALVSGCPVCGNDGVHFQSRGSACSGVQAICSEARSKHIHGSGSPVAPVNHRFGPSHPPPGSGASNPFRISAVVRSRCEASMTSRGACLPQAETRANVGSSG